MLRMNSVMVLSAAAYSTKFSLAKIREASSIPCAWLFRETCATSSKRLSAEISLAVIFERGPHLHSRTMKDPVSIEGGGGYLLPGRGSLLGFLNKEGRVGPLADQQARTLLSVPWAWARPLIKELRSHRPHVRPEEKGACTREAGEVSRALRLPVLTAAFILLAFERSAKK